MSKKRQEYKGLGRHQTVNARLVIYKGYKPRMKGLSKKGQQFLFIRAGTFLTDFH